MVIDSDEMAELKRQARRIIREWPAAILTGKASDGFSRTYKDPPAAHRACWALAKVNAAIHALRLKEKLQRRRVAATFRPCH